MVFFDPDGLKAELDSYKSETSLLRATNYDLRIKNQILRNDRTKLHKKIEIRQVLTWIEISKARSHNLLMTKYVHTGTRRLSRKMLSRRKTLKPFPNSVPSLPPWGRWRTSWGAANTTGSQSIRKRWRSAGTGENTFYNRWTTNLYWGIILIKLHFLRAGRLCWGV